MAQAEPLNGLAVRRNVVHDLTKLDPKLRPETASCRAIVETPKGRRGKLDYDPKLRTFRLKTLLPDGMSFPLDFGFVPRTLADDGDPIDVMILSDEPTPPGVLLDIRLIGAIEAEEKEHGKKERNDRVLAVAAVSHLYAAIKTVDDLEVSFIDNLIQFWTNKDRLEGKEFTCVGVGGPETAVALIEAAMKRADQAKG
ncbi:MAG TPA: inorganic diphosphatase [Caulobacteraceae bacterium]|jgi:inorganic pyrophosphatase|nr:inorganic diphosphatase [Caulobacteraceae bacterium]